MENNYVFGEVNSIFEEYSFDELINMKETTKENNVDDYVEF